MKPGPTQIEMSFVCRNMRKASRDEVFGIFPGSPEDLAAYLHAAPGFHWVGYANGCPAALIGAYPVRRGVWGLYGFGTDFWQLVWRAVTVVARRDMMQAVRDTGAHRAECMSLATHVETHKWLGFLGADHRAEMPGSGMNGEDYVMFSWLKGE